ncbi:ATP-binding cassette sub-family A member 3-like isoform X2 [Tupaia chinensis]|uniref:ATP-binding cassette sub-family A member 3-like isoform X2 n=1 Tax=Tupaia chinensis TaxID=246437 RepID=UPI0003C8EFFC|nr:ATP-binding cassette sub-family A member 3-like isoform X2 [Tupaia chinensis]
MNSLALNQFAVLLWKNFILKRRHFINLILEVLAALVFGIMLSIFRVLTSIKVTGPYHFNSQPISTLPSFLENPSEWELIYVPSVEVVKEITENVKRNLNISIKVRGFSSETEFENYILYDFKSHNVLAAIVFDNDFNNSHDRLPLQVKYHLRFVRIQRSISWPDRTGWKTAFLFPNRPSLGPRNPGYPDGGSPGYIREGFLAIQHALDKAIMLYHESSAGKKLFDGISIFVQRFPYPAYLHDGLLFVSSPFLPLIFILMFSPTVLSIMRSIVWEKEKRLKEYQLIIGLRGWMIWAAYFFTFFLLYIIIISLVCVLFFTKISSEPIFRYSDYSFFFVFLLCYAIASILFGFMVSTLFSKEIGVKWDNLWKSANIEDNLIFGYMLGMLLFDAFLYGLVTWYIETVFPGQYGVPQPWYFFLKRSYWFSKSRIRKKKERKTSGRTQGNFFEAEPTGLVAGIQIENLHKEFRDKAVIKNLSLNIYEGQITVLLGQNGAGKTTTLSILTGRYPPTSGEAHINGYAISTNINKIQKHLGFCPQHDLFFDDLTLSEHVFFYSVIKGIPQKISSVELDHMLTIFNLLEHRDVLSQSLSGGMKRKLSIIIALIGGSKVVILDEPSSGLDPVSRRATWDLLQRYKHNRTILLTTHYMDEADILGDRIAIMVWGTLRCCGSSVFLKRIYGAGYQIVMDKEPHCVVEKVSAMIHSHVPNATLERNIGTELSFILSKEYTERFEALFNDLEKKQKELGIASFGASVSTMEEVFMKVNKLADSQRNVQFSQIHNIKQDEEQNMSVSSSCERPFSSSLKELATIKYNTGLPLHFQQFYSMFLKRALFSLRNWKMILLQIVVILFLTSYLLIALNLRDSNILPAREMDLSQYGQTIVPYSVSGNSDLTLNLIKNLEIFLKPKNQELRKVQGNITNYILESKECYDFCIIAFSIEVEKDKTIMTILFSNEAYHSSATSLAVLDNILFMSLSGPSASIKVSNKPQPLPLYGSNVVLVNGFQIVICLSFGMAIVSGSFGLQTITERINKAKHIQFVSGVYVFTYWLSALLWDLIYFFISCCLLLGVFLFCGVDAFIADYHFLDTMLIFMLYGWCVVPLMYLGSFLFSDSTTALIKLTLFNYFSTICSIMAHIIIQHIELQISNSITPYMRHILMVLPSYNFAMSFSKFFDNYEKKKVCARRIHRISLNCSKSFIQNDIYSFGELGIAKYLVTLAALGLFYFLLLLFLEIEFWNLKNYVCHNIIFNVYKAFIQGKKARVANQAIKECEDEDVKKERENVLSLLQKLQTTPLLLKELTKIYFKCPVVNAVRNISLVVKKSECFGLLGLNGAGKTSIFKMLTGEEPITSGVALVDGISIVEHIRKVMSRIGYCPQSDSMPTHMTGRELLVMYARLWGVPEPNIYQYVEAFLHSLQLETYADEFIYTYSGGTKRILNTAIALMGNSSVVFLDEPSTGMDPVARRLLWDTITLICKTGKAIIITSHRMEECEALCNRLAILVKGKFACLGSAQHLKKKYSNMYTLTVKIKIDNNEDKVKEFKEFIETNFPGNIINQEHQGIIGYYIPRKEICWGKEFSILEEAKVLFNLEDYFFSQITLEQVFLTIANIDKTEK